MVNDGLLVGTEFGQSAQYSILGDGKASGSPDLICLSHLRWDFVFQRPQHLLSRCALERRVFFIEEPIFGAEAPRLDLTPRDCGVVVGVPHLPQGLSETEVIALEQALLIDELIIGQGIGEYILWYYTPMALPFTRFLEPVARVYDCMDELSGFKGAPLSLKRLEEDLLDCVDLVFTGGESLYEAKRHLHKMIFPFPSSIDAAHFGRARRETPEPEDQAQIPRPRLGYSGVIDERMDLDLLAGIADLRPDWHLVMLGPVVKIDPADLPQRPNIHYLGGKDYQQLPAYLSSWDVAMIPFAHNDATRYISPTKTPEYLAAGIPVVSTSITDVVRPYGEQELVEIADTPADFVAACERLMCESFDRASWLERVDGALAENSWDLTWERMMRLIDETIKERYPTTIQAKQPALSTIAAVRPGSLKSKRTRLISPAPGE